MFSIGAIGFDVDGNEVFEFEWWPKLFDLNAEELQASIFTNGDADCGADGIVGGGGVNIDVDGYENGECSDVEAWLLMMGVKGGIGGLWLEYNGGGNFAVFVKSNVITGGVSQCGNGVR